MKLNLSGSEKFAKFGSPNVHHALLSLNLKKVVVLKVFLFINCLYSSHTWAPSTPNFEGDLFFVMDSWRWLGHISWTKMNMLVTNNKANSLKNAKTTT